MGGRIVALTGSQLTGARTLARISAVDPAPGDYRGDAQFVDIIHTSPLGDDALVGNHFLSY